MTDNGWMDGSLPLTEYFCPAILIRTAEVVDIGASNAFNWRRVGSVVSQDQPHNLINVAPGFVIDHIYTLM